MSLGFELWATTKKQGSKIQTSQIAFLRGVKKFDHTKNEVNEKNYKFLT